MTFLNRIKNVLVAAALCAVFIAVNWTVRFPYTFPDLQNYRIGFEGGWYMSSVINLDWLRFIAAEGAWVYGFDTLWRYVGNMDASFLIVSAAAIFLIILYIFARTKSYIAILFIFNPVVVNLVIEQIRSGIATGLFFTGTLIKRPYLQLPFFIAALSVHTSFILFVSFYYVFKICEMAGVKRFFDRNILVGFVAVFSFALFVSYFRDIALASIDDNRAFIKEDQTSGILLAIAWSLFLVNFYIFRSKEEEYGFDIYFFAMNTFMMVASIITGEYGARFVAIGVPALAVMSKHIKRDRRVVFYLHYFLFSVLYFAIWATL